jgi:sugar phosphate isomerase/epimerase
MMEQRARISCSMASFYELPLATAVGIIRDAGFDGVELAAGPESLARGLAATRRILERAGLPALSFHPPLYPVPGWPRSQLGRGRAAAESARELGCEVTVIHAPKSRSLATPRARQYIAAVENARDLGKAHGFVVGLETTQRPTDGRPPLLFDDLAYFLRFADDHGLCVTLDTCHAAANGDDLEAVLAQIGPRLRNIHFSDCRTRPRRKKPATHLPPGAGNTVDLAAFVRALGRSGYTGLITCEISPLELFDWSRRGMVRKLAAVHDFIAKALT